MSIFAIRGSAGVALLALSLAMSGCSGGETPSDPTTAQASLRQALDLWKSGGSMDDLRGTTQIVMSDVDWKAKQQLVDYKILPDQRSDGANIHLTADLMLKGKSAKRPARVTYIIGTQPVVTIHRD